MLKEAKQQRVEVAFDSTPEPDSNLPKEAKQHSACRSSGETWYSLSYTTLNQRQVLLKAAKQQRVEVAFDSTSEPESVFAEGSKAATGGVLAGALLKPDTA